MPPGSRRDLREAWTLFLRCGHLVLAEPTATKLSPANRSLEVLLSQGKASCPCCNDPAKSPMTLRGQLFIGNELRKGCYAQVRNEELAKRTRLTAGQEVVSWSLDTRYIEGIIAGAMSKPIYSLIYENHFQNAHAEWSAKKSEIRRARKTAISEALLPEPMAKLEILLTRTQHDLDYAFAFAHGKLLGQRWADARGEAVPSLQLGPELLAEESEETKRQRSTGLQVASNISRFKTHTRRKARRRLLVKMVRMGEQFSQENEQMALPIYVA